MKIAKAFIALLFSLALLAGQFSFATPAPQAQQKKSCCTKRCCCSKPANSDSTPQPLLPTRANSQTEWQVAAAIAHHIVATISTAATAVETPHFFVPSSSAVPLYQRHCSFLI